MKLKEFPIIPTDEMSAGERLSALKVLSGTYKPATTENLSHFCDCCVNLSNLLAAVVKEITAYSDCVSPEQLYHIYLHLLDNIHRFGRVNQDMIARQYVSIFADYQEEMNVPLQLLNGVIVQFMALPVNTDPNAVELLLSENSSLDDTSDDEELTLYHAHIYKVLPDVVKQVNTELIKLMMENQKQYAVCRGNRNGKELHFIYRTNNERYMADVFPKEQKEEEAYILKSMHDTGRSRHDVLQGRYEKHAQSLKDSKLGGISYAFQDDEEAMAAEMMHQCMEQHSFADLYRDTNMLQYLGDEIKISDQEEYAQAMEQDEEMPTVHFKSLKSEQQVEKNLHLIDAYMQEKKAGPMEWVCFFQVLLFYKHIYPVDFNIFSVWLNYKLGREVISKGRSRQIKSTYWVEKAGFAWIKSHAMESNDTKQMESKFKKYMDMVVGINNILRN